MSGGARKQYTAQDVKAALRSRYPERAYAVFEEVGNGTGSHCRRHADLVAMSLWPSRGLAVVGVEIKVSTADYKKELGDPEKAEVFQQYCDEWWIAAPKGVVDETTLPPTWGLLELSGNSLRPKVKAPKLTPKPLDRVFVAALLRRAAESVNGRIGRAVAEALDANQRNAPPPDRQTERLQRDYDDLSRAVEAFEGASGLTIRNGWNNDRIGEVVRKVLNAPDAEHWLGSMRRAESMLAQTLKRLRDAIPDAEALVTAAANAKGGNDVG